MQKLINDWHLNAYIQVLFDKPNYKNSEIVYELDFSRAANEAENPSDWFNGKGFSSQFAEKIKLDFDYDGISFFRQKIFACGLG